MKKLLTALFLCFFIFSGFAQERYLQVSSKDSINGKPRFTGSLGANIKLNGYFDVFGGLQTSETFNVGLINVFGDDDESAFHMDMHQTQIKFESVYLDKMGRQIRAFVEFDFWGGNGHMRLRKAFVETEHFQIGQNWNAFGDEDLWPNIMEWEGPPSGIWLRSPHIKYFNTFGKNNNWMYEVSLEAPIADYNSYGEVEPLVDETHQVSPDLVVAIRDQFDWGHLRLSSILRNVQYKLLGEIDNFIGYGFSFSGMYKQNKNNFQFQFVGGKGISAYMTSISGLGYDGYHSIDESFNATPAIGGWLSYEHYFTQKLHANAVAGYTNFNLNDVNRYFYDEDLSEEIIVLRGDLLHSHYYGILNVMYDAYERMTFGLEVDYGRKKLDVDAQLNNHYILGVKSRDALRISFGLMFYF